MTQVVGLDVVLDRMAVVARLRVVIRGAVQGVGFRPFVYRLATGLGLCGWVNNSAQGLFIEVEGGRDRLDTFLIRLQEDRPERAAIQSLEPTVLDPQGFTDFQILHSAEEGEKSALILPDIATCADCLEEILDPTDRRYRYPFTNCTNCGPRYSIISALPYDRDHTTMRMFEMCDRCRSEYEDPLDRRFHAQPNACPDCGPHLQFWNRQGRQLADEDEALTAAVERIRGGGIVAVKGMGGFHLMVDARDERAVARLRLEKSREEKPLALMVRDLAQAAEFVVAGPLEERLLRSPEAPIVLLRRRYGNELAANIAPRNPDLGIMLPYTPLHHLLLGTLDGPVVATSGNRAEEPICIDEEEAVRRLGGIADAFLVHNRPIRRQVDDSVVRLVAGRELVLRRARGYAPLPLPLNRPVPAVLAVGAHQKNAVALTVGADAFISQHIGDLQTATAYAAFRQVGADLQGLYERSPALVACDRHPDYASSRFAHGGKLPVVPVQHHYAHVLSCMAENQIEPPVLGVAWDGSGYGTDGTVWGGEFLQVTAASFRRAGHFRAFALPGGEAAVREPRRAALGLLYQFLGDRAFGCRDLEPVRSFPAPDLAVHRVVLRQGLNAPITTSAGRLFDAVAALVGLRQVSAFEGQAAMELEFARTVDLDEVYNFDLVAPAPGSGPRVVDWEPMLREIIEDVRQGGHAGDISARFHNTLVEIIVALALEEEVEKVALTGGCFQNRYLTEQAVQRLQEEGFSPYWHQRVPPNDGGIALGQVMAATRTTDREEEEYVPGHTR